MASGYTAGQWIDMVWLLLSDNTLPAQYSASTASDVHATNNCVQQPPTHTRARAKSDTETRHVSKRHRATNQPPRGAPNMPVST